VIGSKVYRAPGSAVVPGWACAVAFFIIGVVTAAGSPGDPGKGGTAGVVLGVIVGASATVFSLLLGAVLATDRLIVTPAGLICKSNLRSKAISWPEVKSFTVGPGRGRMGWPALIIRLDDDSQVITKIASFTARYPAGVARELTALQADAAAAAVVASPDTAGGQPD
jgi:hypothetical protein